VPTTSCLPEEDALGRLLLDWAGFGFLNEVEPAPYWGGGRGTLSIAFPLVALIKQ